MSRAVLGGLLLALGATGQGTAPVPVEGAKVVAPMDIGVATALLASTCMMMSLYYITNWPDPDIRRYAYQIINSTISIFCAVLLFSAIRDVMDMALDQSLGPATELVPRFTLTLSWYATVQVVLAWCSYQFASEETRESEAKKVEEGNLETRDKVRVNLRTGGVLMAEITGFTAINAFGGLQQLEWFAQSPAHALTVIPMAGVFCGVMSLVTEGLRDNLAMADGEMDTLEEMWDEQVVEAEDEVFGLVTSFLVVQVLRFAVSGILPDEDGEESTSVVFNHQWQEIAVVFAVAAVCTATAYTPKLLSSAFEKMDKAMEQEQTDPLQPHGHTSSGHASNGHASNGHASNGHSSSGRAPHGQAVLPEKSTVEPWQDLEQPTDAEEEPESGEGCINWPRISDTWTTFLAMTSAWCVIFGTRWIIALSGLVGQDETVLAVALAFTLSVCCFCSIWILDKLHDSSPHDDGVQEVVRILVEQVGIIIGFGWERCFEGAVFAISAGTSAPEAWKAVLCVTCVVVVAPAWRIYLVPMEVMDGWRFGFLPHHVTKHANGLKSCDVSRQHYVEVLNQLMQVHVEAEEERLHHAHWNYLRRHKTRSFANLDDYSPLGDGSPAGRTRSGIRSAVSCGSLNSDENNAGNSPNSMLKRNARKVLGMGKPRADMRRVQTAGVVLCE